MNGDGEGSKGPSLFTILTEEVTEMTQLPLFATARTRRPPFPARTLKIEALGDHYRRKTVPLIRLKGKWLREAGFREGGRVLVTVTDGRLLIEPLA